MVSVVTEKSSLKTRLYQLEQELLNLRAQKSNLETENNEKSRKQRILETELENLKRIRAEEVKEKEKIDMERSNEILQRISKLKAHIIKSRQEIQ